VQAPARLRFHSELAGPGAGHYSSRRLAGPPRACACAGAPGLFIMKQASVGLRVRRILRASSYYKSRADWNPIAAGKLPDWIPSRIIPRAPRAGALGRLLPALDSVCV
jgi:hypothetical protein